jgi:hypothetical protein
MPSTKYVDLRLSRRFTIKEDAKIEVLGEFFNIFNRTQVTGINNQFTILPARLARLQRNFRSDVRNAKRSFECFFFRGADSTRRSFEF